jgi:hypothetical protein
LFENVTIDFDQPWEDFRADPALQRVLDAANAGSLFGDTRALRERVAALVALHRGIGVCP